MKLQKQAFTFVELIVVVAILAILATIGFGSYQWYLTSWRDTNRIVQLEDIHDGLELMTVSSKLPFPENMIQLEANGTVFAYQWYAGKSVIDSIWYDGGGKDPEFWEYFTYMLGGNGRDFQLMTFVSDATLLWNNFSKSAYATDYSQYFPKVIWKPLGVLVDKDTQDPLQEIEDIKLLGKYDIVTGTGILASYYSDKDFIYSDHTTLLEILPKSSCKRISDLWWEKGNGEYTINLNGGSKKRVYCNMDIDGWWWTLVARSISWWSWAFSWLIERWDIRDDTSVYSLWPDVTSLNFSEIMLWTYSAGKTLNRAVKVDVDKTYVKDSSNFKYMRGTKWCTEIYSTLWSFRSACDTTWEDGKTADRNQFNVWWNFHKADDTPRDQYFFDQNTGLFTNNTTGWSLNGGVTANGYTNGDGGSWLASGFGEFVNEQAIIFVR